MKTCPLSSEDRVVIARAQEEFRRRFLSEFHAREREVRSSRDRNGIDIEAVELLEIDPVSETVSIRLSHVNGSPPKDLTIASDFVLSIASAVEEKRREYFGEELDDSIAVLFEDD